MRIRIAQASDDLALQKLKATTSPRYPDHAPEPGQVVLVATESARSVFGYLVGTVQGAYSGPGRPMPPPHGYLQTIAVATGVRRQGIGSRLVETFAEQCRAAALAWIFLFPDEDTGVQARVRFFSSCGFHPTPSPDEHWPPMGRWI